MHPPTLCKCRLEGCEGLQGHWFSVESMGVLLLWFMSSACTSGDFNEALRLHSLEMFYSLRVQGYGPELAGHVFTQECTMEMTTPPLVDDPQPCW